MNSANVRGSFVIVTDHEDIMHGGIQGLELHEAAIQLLGERVGGLAIVTGDDERAAAFFNAVGQGSGGGAHADQHDGSAFQRLVAAGRVSGEW